MSLAQIPLLEQDNDFSDVLVFLGLKIKPHIPLKKRGALQNEQRMGRAK